MFSAPLRRSILESDTFESYQSQRNCYGIYASAARILCLPADYLIKDGEVKLAIMLKAEEESYKIYSKFSTKDIDQDFLNRLFKDNNFQFASGSAKIQAIYRMTSVTFTPLNFAGAFKLINPSLPEIHVGGFSQRVLRVTQNFYFKNMVKGSDLFLAPSGYVADRNFFRSDFDALDAIVIKPKVLVKKRRERHSDVDGSMAWYWRREWLPSLALRFENILSKDSCDSCETAFVDVEHDFLRKTRLMASSYVTHPVGKSVLAAGFPFAGIFRDHDPLERSVTYIFQLSQLNSFFSFSPLIYSFGFIFTSDLYRIGLQYSDEKQDNSIELERHKRTNVFASFSI